MAEKIKQTAIRNTASIFLCFLLTSTGYFVWMNRLEHLVSADTADVMTTVIGYFLQAAGVGVFVLLQRRKQLSQRALFLISLSLYCLLLPAAAYGQTLAVVLAAGFADSVLCGVIAGQYLYDLSASVTQYRRATVFGVAYGLATVASWLLSLLPRFYETAAAIAVCCVLAVAAAGIALRWNATTVPDGDASPHREALGKVRWLSVAVVMLFSLVNNIGFASQSAAVSAGLRLEFSRMFYAVGLLAAGLVGDKNRRNGAVCALAALAIPFITLALQGEALPQTVFWALGYFGFGFYAVYRITLFSDIAARYGLPLYAGFGLLFGRVGDALGTGLCLLLNEYRIALIAAAAALFAVTVFLFFRFYQRFYVPRSETVKTEQEIFNDFAADYALSHREREVLRFLLAEKTNKEIAETLFVSESTVKFHVHNLLKKTGTGTRLELLALYSQQADRSAQT